MKRLYYVSDNIDTVDAISEALHSEGITDWNFHVMSKDELGLYRHRLHSANPLHRQNVLRFGERGGIIGLLAGVLVAALVVGWLDYFASHPQVAFVVMVVIITLHGIWIGCLAGLSSQNYKIRQFRADIEAGRYLLMIDVDRAHYGRVKELLQRFRSAAARGEDTPLVLPFGSAHG